MYSKNALLISLLTGESVRIVEYQKNGYYSVIDTDEPTAKPYLIHEANLSDKPFVDDWLNFKYGEGEIFSNKLYMLDVYLFVKFTLGEVFGSIEYISEDEFIVKIGAERKQFKLELCEYNGDFFRWNSDTFKTNADYIFQVGEDFVRIFSVSLRQMLGSNVTMRDGKMLFSFEENGVLRTGAISTNPEKTKFGCQLSLVMDYIHDSRIDKPKSETDRLIEENIKLENIIQDGDGMARIVFVEE